MSQQSKILSLLKAHKTVSCKEFGPYVYHKLASRVSDLRKKGYVIEYIPSDTDSPMDAKYVLVSEPLAPITYREVDGQMEIAI